MTEIVAKFKSRKFLLSLAAVIYSVFRDDPKYAAAAAIVYTIVEGWIDNTAMKG